MKYIPRKDRVLVLPLDIKKTKTKSGILIPNMANDNLPHCEATVIAKGEDVHEGLKIGDRVAYMNGAGTPLTIKEEDHNLLRDQDVMMIIREDDE